MSSAIRSLTVAVGVGFLLNSISKVTSWSWVALCLFWFFCCWVKVLFRGGLRDAEVLLAEFDAVGDGVEDIFVAASSCDRSDMLGNKTVGIYIRAALPALSTSNYLTNLFCRRLLFVYVMNRMSVCSPKRVVESRLGKIDGK